MARELHIKIKINAIFAHQIDQNLEEYLRIFCIMDGASQVALVVKNLPANTEDIRDGGLISGWGRSPEGGHDNPFQYSCLENPHEQRILAGYCL